ncbi:HupE/UreJ family protein [Oceanicoccus sagamiensis]|uniref:HupE / UreJ protein n=1 Tax=Oceanicoccus sagamiensis TaxID=716816 RepID=A0A1X9ND35_9GAMM|nr:HupE/UreJ family protein [Oceanicoccus sagamiensis]ARN74322.1 hypothetical protein BST96_09410 [Oceanicoccus sagamiensis]
MIRLLLILLFSISALSQADDMRPASLTITASDASQFDVLFKMPIRNGSRQQLEAQFDDATSMPAPKSRRIINNAYIENFSLERKAGLEGMQITIAGLKGASGDVLLRIIDNQQHTITAVLNTENPDYTVPVIKEMTKADTVVTYIILGVEHILVGLDHLLFVACLVYISGSRNKLLLTITGFTVAHSVTLILAATDTLVIPIPPVEAVIALSIVFLAWEIAKNNKNSLSLKYPILVSSSFGLLHGFGFASVLAEIGLPQNEKLLALLSFNIGVEIGQVLFVAALFAVFYLLSKLMKFITMETLRYPASYTCGIVATFWMFERLASF